MGLRLNPELIRINVGKAIAGAKQAVRKDKPKPPQTGPKIHVDVDIEDK